MGALADQEFRVKSESGDSLHALGAVASGHVKITPGGETGSLKAAIGEKPARAAWTNVHQAADRVNVDRLAEERQARDEEIKRHRELALQLIDLGYCALALASTAAFVQTSASVMRLASLPPFSFLRIRL
jgi:hypothetical protein